MTSHHHNNNNNNTNNNININNNNNIDTGQTEISQALNYADYLSNLEHLRCRIDVLDMTSQPDDEFHHIMIYQEEATNFLCLKSLRDDGVVTMASCLIDMFCELGTTLIVSGRCREWARLVTLAMKK